MNRWRIALTGKTKIYVPLPFGFEAHGSCYGNAHTQSLEQVWKSHQAFTAALASPTGTEEQP